MDEVQESYNKNFLKLKKKFGGRHFWAIEFGSLNTGNITD